MNKEEYTKLDKIWTDDVIISVDELENKNDRTLLYGYDTGRGTWHIYLKNNSIHVFVYEKHYNFNSADKIETLSYNDGHEINTDKIYIIPNKRLYPEACDFEFCALLKRKGFALPFTTFQDDREPKKFYGETYIFS